MNIDSLNEQNFMLYAAHYYDNVNCIDSSEFEDDLNRIKYIKKLFKKYKETGELRERLILNHLTVLYNVFYHEACTKMLFLRLKEYLHYLKPFLLFLNYWPDMIKHANNVIDFTSKITMDQKIIDTLRKI